MKIDIEVIERVLKAALDQFKTIYGSTIEVDSDFYWTVASPAKFSIYETPEPGLGSLADHMERVEKVANGEYPDPLLLQDIGEILKHCADAQLKIGQD